MVTHKIVYLHSSANSALILILLIIITVATTVFDIWTTSYKVLPAKFPVTNIRRMLTQVCGSETRPSLEYSTSTPEDPPSLLPD